MKNIGLYFGTFNPIHIGHLIIANFMANHTDLEEVWYVVTPLSPSKDINSLLPDFHRLQMVKLAIKENEKLQVTDIEFDLPKPNYTIHTLAAIQQAYPDCNFSIIMGEDNIRSFHQWKNYRDILKNHEILVYPRTSDVSDLKSFVATIDGNVHVYPAPLMEISSTFIRESIRSRKDVRYLLPEAVTNYISNNYLYENPPINKD